MKKILVLWAILCSSLVFGQVSGNVTSLTPVVSFPTQTATATCSGSACPTFTFNGMCTGVVRVAGTNSALSIVTQATNDNTNYSPITVGVVGAGITGNPGSLTTSIITANGLYYFNVPAMTRLRFVINTLTGTNVTFKVTISADCSSTSL